MAGKAIVHVIGTGTIGEPLIGLLTEMKEPARDRGGDVPQADAAAHTTARRSSTSSSAAPSCASTPAPRRASRTSGWSRPTSRMEALERAAVVIDCTPSGVGIAEQERVLRASTRTTRWASSPRAASSASASPTRAASTTAPCVQRRGSVHPGRLLQHAQPVDPDRHAGARRTAGPTTSSKGASSACVAPTTSRRTTASSPRPRSASTRTPRFGTHHARDAWHLFNTMGYDLEPVLVGDHAQHAVHAHDLLRHPGQEADDDGAAARAHPAERPDGAHLQELGEHGVLVRARLRALRPHPERDGRRVCRRWRCATRRRSSATASRRRTATRCCRRSPRRPGSCIRRTTRTGSSA